MKLSINGLTAQRSKSYNHALVVSAEPLEDNLLYQVIYTLLHLAVSFALSAKSGLLHCQPDMSTSQIWFISLSARSGLFHCLSVLVYFTVCQFWSISLSARSGLFHCLHAVHDPQDLFLHQVEVKELSVKRFVGCIKIGVTSLPLETVCGWKKWTSENDATGNTTVLDRTEDGRLCVCTRAQVSLTGRFYGKYTLVIAVVSSTDSSVFSIHETQCLTAIVTQLHKCCSIRIFCTV